MRAGIRGSVYSQPCLAASIKPMSAAVGGGVVSAALQQWVCHALGQSKAPQVWPAEAAK